MLSESNLVSDSLFAFSGSRCQNQPWFLTHSMLFPLVLSESNLVSDSLPAFFRSCCRNQTWFLTHSLLFLFHAVGINLGFRLTPCFFRSCCQNHLCFRTRFRLFLIDLSEYKKVCSQLNRSFLYHKFFKNNLTTSAPPINKPRDVPKLHNTIINKIRVTLLCQKPFTL